MKTNFAVLAEALRNVACLAIESPMSIEVSPRENAEDHAMCAGILKHLSWFLVWNTENTAVRGSTILVDPWEFTNGEHMAMTYLMAADIVEDPEFSPRELTWAVSVVAQFAYRDGFVKRYPIEDDYNKAMAILNNQFSELA